MIDGPFALPVGFFVVAVLHRAVNVGTSIDEQLNDLKEIVLMLLKLSECFGLFIDVPLDFLASTSPLQLLLPYSLDILVEVALGVNCELPKELQQRFTACSIDLFE